jgi:PleD family two-component response regulator
VESEIGGCSTFWFLLPMQRTISDEEKQKSSNTQKIIYNNVFERKKLKILIAEHLDSEYNLLKDYLNERYVLYGALDREDAISIFFKEMPDIILWI